MCMKTYIYINVLNLWNTQYKRKKFSLLAIKWRISYILFYVSNISNKLHGFYKIFYLVF